MSRTVFFQVIFVAALPAARLVLRGGGGEGELAADGDGHGEGRREGGEEPGHGGGLRGGIPRHCTTAGGRPPAPTGGGQAVRAASPGGFRVPPGLRPV